MELLPDDRAQSVQIGAVLLFGILIILLASWQAFVIPDQNEAIEFNHNQDVQQQMTEVRTTVNSMPDAAATRSATIDLGTRYPTRTIFRNPPPAAGTIETVGTTDSDYNVSIENATATDENVDDFWNGSLRRYDTGAIQYRPSYNLYASAPRTIYEHSVLYNKFERQGQDLSVTGQTLVRDDRITVVALNGTFRENRIDSTSVDFDPISTQTRTVRVGNASHNVTISSPTAMEEDEWQSVFEDEMTENGGNVLSVSTTEFAALEGFSMLEVTLQPGTYTLQLAKVGVGTRATDTEASYTTDVAGNGSQLRAGETESMVVEVRDEFNRPVSGVTVHGQADSGTLARGTRETGTDGQATFTYESDGVQSDTDRINFSFLGPVDGNFDGSAPENVSMTVTVQQLQTGGGGGQLPGPRPINLTLESDTVTEGGTLSITNASFDNQGTWDRQRGGTDVVAGEYYVVEGDVTDPTAGGAVVRGSLSEDDALPLTTTEDPGLTLSMTGTIDTASPTNLDPGNYTVFIRGQDTRGIWTNESVDGFFSKSFEVTEEGANLTAGTVEESDNQFIFTIENSGSNTAIIEQFKIEEDANQQNWVDSGNANELEIRDATVEGRANRGANGQSGRFTFGNTYDLVSDSDGEGNEDGQYAEISPDDGLVTVDIRDIDKRLDNGGNNPLEFTDSEADAYVTVTFILADGTEQVFYFEQTGS